MSPSRGASSSRPPEPGGGAESAPRPVTVSGVPAAISSGTCVCGGPKTPGRLFCRWCLISLPDRLSGPLRGGLTQGLGAAYDEAVRILRELRGLEAPDAT